MVNWGDFDAPFDPELQRDTASAPKSGLCVVIPLFRCVVVDHSFLGAKW
jgi:hypothetical protein